MVTFIYLNVDEIVKKKNVPLNSFIWNPIINMHDRRICH